MRPNRACGAGDEKGVAVVEFALVIPVLLVLLLGMLDFGKALNYWIDETNLAASGARLAVVNNWPGKGTTPLSQYVQQLADTNELKDGGTTSVPSSARVCITFPPVGHTAPQAGDPVRVTVSVSYHWLPFLAEKMSLAASTITGEATMRLEAAGPLAYTNNECYPA
jgi:Flp pilus assembly protein TadG